MSVQKKNQFLNKKKKENSLQKCDIAGKTFFIKYFTNERCFTGADKRQLYDEDII